MFSFTSIAAYREQLCSGATTCTIAVSHYLECIQANKYLNAFVEVYATEALALAAKLDAQRTAGSAPKSLHGVVIAIKDVICYEGHAVTAASAMLKGYRSPYTATALQFLIDEEAIIIGNCNCDEFAMGSSNEHSVYGPVHNAYDTSKVPGGSSGGSAVAVQAGLCMAALGSDTGGSVRQPADFCGIVGFKPGYGTISRYGLIAYASSFDQIGIFGKNIADLHLILKLMSRNDPNDSTMNTVPISTASLDANDKKFRIAYFSSAMNHPSLDEEIALQQKQYLLQLREEGHIVDAVDFDMIDYIVPAYYVLTTAEASSNLSRYDGIRYGHRPAATTADLTGFYTQNRTEGFGKEVKRRIMLGTFVLSSGYYDAYFSKAQQVRGKLVDAISSIFKTYDAIALPTSPVTAFPIGEKNQDPMAMYLADIYTVLANLTGIPAISLPLFRHSNGMPFGLQLLAARKDEVTLLQLSQQLMQRK